ncbi:MAG: rhamnogalacturonan acetylesterase [Clostridia bacterium]|nr:rhamnogalacturonan acetylesterase [Clostridia bacterium]
MNKIYIIGDSTVENGDEPFRGWGWALHEYVREGVTVENHAKGGRSSLSFFNEGRFEPVEREMGKGDLLLIQFGHNDEKDDAERHTDPDSTYPAQLWHYCEAALKKGAQPVLITPTCRRFFSEPHSLMYTHGEYPLAVRRLSWGKGLPLCDLTRETRKLYLDMGQDKVAELFVRLAPGEHPDFPDGHDDRTHFNAHGARTIAGIVARTLKRICECAPFIRENV